LKVKLLLQK